MLRQWPSWRITESRQFNASCKDHIGGAKAFLEEFLALRLVIVALAQADTAHAPLDNKYLVLGKEGKGWTLNCTTQVNSQKQRLPVLVTSSVFAREEKVKQRC